MQERVYEIIILGWPAENMDDAAAPRCYANSLYKAAEIARPWVEGGHDAGLRMITREDEAHE